MAKRLGIVALLPDGHLHFTQLTRGNVVGDCIFRQEGDSVAALEQADNPVDAVDQNGAVYLQPLSARQLHQAAVANSRALRHDQRI